MTSADRPPTILSEHGEGYCGVCRFVEGLDFRGRMYRHRRGADLGSQITFEYCKGSGRKPWKRTPYASRKSMFRMIAVGLCPKCGQQERLMRFAADAPTIARHNSDYTGSYCAGTGLAPGDFAESRRMTRQTIADGFGLNLDDITP